MIFWRRLFLDDAHRPVARTPAPGDPALLSSAEQSSSPPSSASVFLILRRMRMPLIALIVIFAT